jgi:predicted TIM-barrel fold metal-dependent hydrolase
MSQTQTTERLVSSDSHVMFTDEWVKARLAKRMHAVWDGAVSKQREHQKRVNQGGQPDLDMKDFVDLDAAMDPGHFEPHAKLQAMDRDGVYAEVIFPEVGGAKYCTPKLMGDDWKEGLRGFNDGMADFASVDPVRMLTAYQVPLYDVDFAVKEVLRMAERGARAVQIPPFPWEHGLPDVHDRGYDPLWSVLAETGIVVLNHLDLKESLWDTFRRDPTPQKGIFTAIPSLAISETLAFWILTGTLERFPKLNVIVVEPGLGWLPWFFEGRLRLLRPRAHLLVDGLPAPRDLLAELAPAGEGAVRDGRHPGRRPPEDRLRERARRLRARVARARAKRIGSGMDIVPASVPSDRGHHASRS